MVYVVFPAKDDLLFFQIPRLILHNQQAFTTFGRSLRYVENASYTGITARNMDGIQEALETRLP